MIEFKGKLTGKAEAFMVKKDRLLGFYLALFSVLVVGPIALPLMAKAFQMTSVYWVFGSMLALFAVAPLILPKTMFVNKHAVILTIAEDEITYRLDVGPEKENDPIATQEDSRMTYEVEQLTDYGDFYYAAIARAKANHRYIFQKDLLTQGTLEDFEALFDGKIVRAQEFRK